MEFRTIRFEAGPWNGELRAIEEPLPDIYRVPIMHRSHPWPDHADIPFHQNWEKGYAEYELQNEYDLETDEVCGQMYKLINAPEWYYKHQLGSAFKP